MVLLQAILAFVEFISILDQLLLGSIKLLAHFLLFCLKCGMLLINSGSLLEGFTFFFLLGIRKSNKLVVVYVMASRILVVCNNGQLVQFLLYFSFKIVLNLLNSIISYRLYIHEISCQVDFLL